MQPESDFYPRIMGGVYGQALGDAWAMPAHFRPDQTWAYYGGWIDRLLPASPDHPVHAGFRAGQITDDTQQALALAGAIVADGQVTVEGVARALVAWYEHVDGENASFIGYNTRRAISSLKAGVDPHLTGLRGDTIGGAMRVSPVGLIHPGDPDAAIADAILACTPTHFTDVAVSGACAVAAAVAQALAPETTLEEIVQVAMRAAEIGREHGVPWLGGSVTRKIEYAIQLAVDSRFSEQERLQNLYDLIGSTLATADSVPCAFGVLAMGAGLPVQTAVFAAGLSGDADSVGAIACAIAGAWHGIESIPDEYIEILNNANPEYNFEQVAAGLYDLARRNSQAITPVDENSLKILLNNYQDER
jgi:ADP-ribosylglycohydrolase